MKYDTLLMDIDDTLFDFRASSFDALTGVFGELGASFSKEDMPVYDAINDELWRSYERGEIEKDFLYPERFRQYLSVRGIEADPVSVNDRYMKLLAEGRHFMPHCEQLLRALHGKYGVYIVTNGDTYVQERRIARSGMGQYFDAVFISEQMGCKKPEKAFFDRVFETIGPEKRKSCLLVGDSLSSDMQGGRNAGVPTCFYGRPENADDRCDYVIGDLMDLLKLL